MRRKKEKNTWRENKRPYWLKWFDGPVRYWSARHQDYLLQFVAAGKGRTVALTQPDRAPFHVCVWERELIPGDEAWLHPEKCCNYNITAPRRTARSLPSQAIYFLTVDWDEFNRQCAQQTLIN